MLWTGERRRPCSWPRRSERAEAARRGLGVVGTVGVLTQARDQGLIATALPLLLELHRLGQWMSEALLQTAREEEAGRPS